MFCCYGHNRLLHTFLVSAAWVRGGRLVVEPEVVVEELPIVVKAQQPVEIPAQLQLLVLQVRHTSYNITYLPFSQMYLFNEREMFYLTMHSTHFIYGYMATDMWLRTILIVRKETRCRHIGYSYRLTARVLLYAPSHRQDNTYHGLYYTSRGALAGTRNSSMGPPHEGSIRRPTAPWANALPLSYVPLPLFNEGNVLTHFIYGYMASDTW